MLTLNARFQAGRQALQSSTVSTGRLALPSFQPRSLNTANSSKICRPQNDSELRFSVKRQHLSLPNEPIPVALDWLASAGRSCLDYVA